MPTERRRASSRDSSAVILSGSEGQRFSSVADTPIRRYADTPMRRYADTPIRRYADTPIRRNADAPTRLLVIRLDAPRDHVAIQPGLGLQQAVDVVARIVRPQAGSGQHGLDPDQ